VADPISPSDPPAPPTLDEQRLQAVREQTAAIQAQTAALIAAREASQQAQAAMLQALAEAPPAGLSEAFVLTLLRLVLDKPAPPAATG